MVAEIADAIGQSGCGFRRVATGKVFRAEVLIASTVAKHMVDRCQDRCGYSNRGLLRTMACFKPEKLCLEVAVLLARCPSATVLECGTEWGITPTWPAAGSL